MKHSQNLLAGLLAGGIIGLGLGILYAPSRGSETRKNIARQAELSRTALGIRADHLTDQAIKYYVQNKENLDLRVLTFVAQAAGNTESNLIAALEEKLAKLRRMNRQVASLVRPFSRQSV